ncbi:MAG: MFS transporter [Clostridiales bacterium]|nr:MFS transporter [Clostridiales bacterium]
MLKKQPVLNGISDSRFVFFSMWIIYAAAYFGRTCYSAAIAAITADGLFTKSEAGVIGTVFFLCYGSGQIINGFLGDKISPFGIVLTGTLLSSFCCFTMGTLSSHLAMAAVWGLNGFAQSMLWSPLLKILSSVLRADMRKRACLNIALSHPIGTTLSYFSCSAVIKYDTWHHVFTTASAFLLLAFIFGVSVFLAVRRRFVYTEPEILTEEAADGASVSLKTLILASGLIAIVIPTILHGMLRDGITTWVPTMLSETYKISPSFSVMITLFLPLINAFGAYMITPVYKKLRENELKTSVVCAVLGFFPLIVLLFIGKIPMAIETAMLAVTTASMYALNYMLITKVPMRFSKFGKTSTVSGILNSFAYLGCGISTYGFGKAAEVVGWQKTIVIWLITVALIFIVCLFCIKKWTSFLKKTEQI